MVLVGVCRWEYVGLLLKRWTPLFDSRTERYDLLPIWVKFPNLPFELWSMDFFRLVGNTLGVYLETDLSFLETGVCCRGKVLVLLDLRQVLAANLLIKRGISEFCQPIDYMGLPFRCNRCHAYGHLIFVCSLSFKKHFKLVSASRQKAVWCVKVVGKKLGVLGRSQVVHEDAVSENLASLKPLCTSTLSVFESLSI